MAVSIMKVVKVNMKKIFRNTYNFLVAKLLYNYLCPSVRMSVRFRGKRDFLGP